MTNEERPPVLLIADAGHEIGAGHVMRSLTIGYELLVRGHPVSLLSNGLPDPLASRAMNLGIAVIPRRSSLCDLSIADEVAELQPSFVLRDGYQFSIESAEALERVVPGVAVIDDNYETPVGRPTLLVNPNVHGVEISYTLPSTTVRLLGSRYALIRREIANMRISRENDVISRGIFVSMGGSDPRNLKGQMVEALSRLGLPVECASGLMTTPTKVSRFEEGLSRCSLAILSAGSQTWEAAYLGVPVISIATVDNQISIAKSTEKVGIGTGLDWRSNVNLGVLIDLVKRLLSQPRELARMRSAALDLVDGRGGFRVAAEISQLCVNYS